MGSYYAYKPGAVEEYEFNWVSILGNECDFLFGLDTQITSTRADRLDRQYDENQTLRKFYN